MKKNILTIALGLIMAINAQAKDCEAGRIFNIKNGAGEMVEYCVGTGGLNWYAAVAWCHSQGREMPTFEFACGNLTPDYPCYKLGVIGIDGLGWLKNSYDKDYAYAVWLKDRGGVDRRLRGQSVGYGAHFPLCY